MSITFKNDTSNEIEYTDNWFDNYEDYIFEDFDFRNDDRKGFIIQIPNFRQYEKRDFNDYLKNNFYDEMNDSTSTYFKSDQVGKMGWENEKYDEFKDIYIKDNSPVKMWGKQSGNYIAFGANKDGSYTQLGNPSSNPTALMSRIDKKQKLRNEIYDPISKQTFATQEDFEKYQQEENTKLIAKRYGDFYDTYSKYYTKDNKIKDQELSNALDKSEKWMDNYIENTRPDNPYGNPVGTPENQDQNILAYKELKVIEYLQYPERLSSLINWAFGNEENTNPFDEGYPVTVHHPIKTEVLQTVLDEMEKHKKDTNPNVKKMMDKGREYLKQNKSPSIQKISQALDESKKEDTNVVVSAFDFIVKDLIPSIASFEYQGGNRKARNDVWYGTENVIKALTTNKKGNRMQYTVNGRSTNEVRQAIDANQDWLEPIISNPYAFENNSNYYAFLDLVAVPLLEDLIKEYKVDNGWSSGSKFVPLNFMNWLYQHPDKKYSSTEDDGFYSYYELVKIGHNANGRNMNALHQRIMDVDVNMLGAYNTAKSVVKAFEDYKRTRIHPKDNKPNYNGKDLYKQMIHEKPELLISKVQQSKRIRKDSFSQPNRDLGLWNEYQEQNAIKALIDAFGQMDESGEIIDWYSLEPSEFPTPDDILDSYLDPMFLNEPIID